MKLPSGLKLGGMGAGLGKLGGLKPLAKPETVPDPLASVVPTGSEEVDTKAELNALQLGFKARREREAQRYKNATDSEFWFAVCFHTREQKEQFLRLAQLIELGDKYLDGLEVAKALNITLKD
jgi:hypothetical protein